MATVTADVVVDEETIHLVVTTRYPSTAALEQRIEYDLEVCPSPTCHCSDMTLVRAAALPGSKPPVEYLLDPFARTVTEPATSGRVPGQPAGQAIAEAIPAEDWHRLRAAFFGAKERAIATADWSREQAEFPFEDIERWSQLVPLRDVIPFMPHLTPPADGEREFTIDDQYCVLPSCDCTESVVALLTYGSPDPSTSRIQAEPLVDFQIDWQRNRWRVAGQTRRLTAAEEQLRDRLLAANPDLLVELRRRQEIMRKLYEVSVAAWRAETGRVPLRAGPRIGRNDPCPCGSGKKYKRCCGNPA